MAIGGALPLPFMISRALVIEFVDLAAIARKRKKTRTRLTVDQSRLMIQSLPTTARST